MVQAGWWSSVHCESKISAVKDKYARLGLKPAAPFVKMNFVQISRITSERIAPCRN